MDFLAFILILVVVTGVVTLVAAAFIRSNTLCIVASALIAELLFILYALVQAADSPHPEDMLLGVNITLMVGTPVFILSAFGFTFLARKMYRRGHENG